MSVAFFNAIPLVVPCGDRLLLPIATYHPVRTHTTTRASRADLSPTTEAATAI